MPIFGPPSVSRLADKRDLKGLTNALNYRKDGGVREAAARALGTLGDRAAVAPLIAAFEDDDARVRRAAAEALGHIGGATAAMALLPHLQDADIDVRCAAAQAIAQIEPDAASEEFARAKTQAIELLIADLRHNNPEVWSAAAQAAAQMQPHALPSEHDRLKNTIYLQRVAVLQPAAARVLGCLQDPRAINPLITNISIGTSEAYLAALAQIGALAVDPLIAALGNRDKWIREGVAVALGKIGEPRAAKPLTVALRDKHWRVRKAAAEALERIGWQPTEDENGAAYWIEKGAWDACVALGERATGPLIAALGYEFNEQRGPAAKALVRIGTAAVEPLIAALKDKNGTISAAVAQTLGDIGDTRAIEPLLGALRDGKKAVRQSAARALGQVEDPRAVEPLIAALADPEESVGEAAAKALEALSVPRGLEAVQQWRETAQKAQPARPKPDAHASRCGEKIGIVHILSANNPYADVVGIASNVDAEVMRRFGELLDIPMCKISVSPNEGKIVFAYTTLEIEPAGGAQLQQAISEIAERYNQ